MIHALNGIVQTRKKQAITLAVGPISLELSVADESYFAINKPTTIYTYLHWNSEKGPSLYGFMKEVDRAVFLLVTSCTGVGPRLGLAVLADLGASGFIQAIQKEDGQMMSKVSGIGAKKAEQLIVQLKHKVHTMLESGIAIETTGGHIDWHTVSEALRALDYSRNEISQAISFIRSKNSDSSISFDHLLRQALSFLSKQA